MPFTKETAKAMGKLGGLKTKRKYGKKYFKRLVNKRYGKSHCVDCGNEIGKTKAQCDYCRREI